MKKIITVIFILTLGETTFSQENKINSFVGMWKITPFEKGYDDSTFVIFKSNKSILITYRLDSKKVFLYGDPFTYYGFWDTLPDETSHPKHIKDLKQTGKYVFFYDHLIENDKSGNKSGYDKFGNLYQITRECQWAINDELPEGLPPTTLTLHFGKDPDVYRKVDKIPDYVLISLRKNKEDWQRYLDFMEHKESKVTQLKAFIYTIPNQQSKMYLLKGDEVEILETQDDWLKIRYYGSKTIEGWIRKTDVE